MQKFIKTNLRDIPLENAHGGSGKRQVLVKPEHVTTGHLDAVTKGFLDPGNAFDWHSHSDTDEMFIVLSGQGKFYCNDEVVEYSIHDVISIPANLKHKIEATGNATSEFYFIRIKV